MAFGKLGALGRGFGRLGAGVGAAQASTSLYRSFSSGWLFPGQYANPSRVRPFENRSQLIIQNAGATVLQAGYRTTGNNSNFTVTSYTILINPGQEYVENGYVPALGMQCQLYIRPNVNGEGADYHVYLETNGAAQSGTAVVRAIRALPIAIPAFNVISQVTSPTRILCGTSRDGLTWYYYDSATKHLLYKSTDGGATFSQANNTTFTANILGVQELEDGGFIVITQGAAAAPGIQWKATAAQWQANPFTATFTSILTSASQGYFRPVWDGGHFCSDGRNAINNSGKYRVTAEYGPFVVTPVDPTKPTHVYWSKDYGDTYATVFDLQTDSYTSPSPGHIKAAAYDPWDHRIYITFDLLANQSTTKSWIMYSDIDVNGDPGTWVALDLPTEWQGVSANFQSNSIAISQRRKVFGSDHLDGFYIFPSTGYRTPGRGFLGANISMGTGSQQTNLGAHRNDTSSRAFFSIGFSTGGTTMPSIYCDNADDFGTQVELWRATDTAQPSPEQVFGPGFGGIITANQTGAKQLRGTLVPGVLGHIVRNRVLLTANGVITVFNVPHYMAGTPTTFLHYPQNAEALTAEPNLTVTADATNVIFTFSSAPATGTLSYQLRLQ